MQIQINSDDNIEGNEDLTRQVEEEINKTLGRFGEQIMRIEVHLGDENAGKAGTADKRCVMEARLAGLDPEAASHHGASVEDAYRGAAKKLRRTLDKKLGRLNDHKGAPSIRTEGF